MKIDTMNRNDLYLIEYISKNGDVSEKIVTINPTYFENFYKDKVIKNKRSKNLNDSLVTIVVVGNDKGGQINTNLDIRTLKKENITLMKQIKMPKNKEKQFDIIKQFENSEYFNLTYMRIDIERYIKNHNKTTQKLKTISKEQPKINENFYYDEDITFY